MNGAANILQVVHTWNSNGIGIKVNSHQTRILACYLDHHILEVNNPFQLTVTDTFFLEAHANFVGASSLKVRPWLISPQFYLILPHFTSIYRAFGLIRTYL